MGTRNLTAVIVNGEHKIAQYGQWDGYPEGAGKEIFYFLKKIIKGNKIDVFKEKISECRFITQKELDAKYEQLRDSYQQQQQELLSLEEARKNKPNLWK